MVFDHISLALDHLTFTTVLCLIYFAEYLRFHSYVHSQSYTLNHIRSIQSSWSAYQPVNCHLTLNFFFTWLTLLISVYNINICDLTIFGLHINFNDFGHDLYMCPHIPYCPCLDWWHGFEYPYLFCFIDFLL